MAQLFNLIWHAWHPPADPTQSFAGKAIIVTGATTGIGFEAAVKFVKLGAARVIISTRDTARGEKAKTELERLASKAGIVETWPLDMDSYASIQAFAKRAAELPRLDAAVLNAGVYQAAYETSPYDWEETLQVNTLSTVLLGILLLPTLQAAVRADGARPVLEFTGSGRHQRVGLDVTRRPAPDGLLASFNDRDTFKGDHSYAWSKLFLQYAVQVLAERTRPVSGAEPDVLVLSACPGMARSNLARQHLDSFLKRAGAAVFFGLFARTAEQGSRSIVSGATLGPEAHGRFWQHDEIRP